MMEYIGPPSWNATDATTVTYSSVDTTRDDVSTTIRDVVMKGFYIAIGSVGILNNALVLFVMFRLTNMRKRNTTLFIINQSIIDLLTAFLLLATTVLPSDGRVFLSVADDLYCRLWVSRMPLWLCITCSTLNLVALTLERYASVVHPIAHKLSFTRAKAFVAIALAWFLAALFNVLNAVLTAYTQDGVCKLYVFNSVDAMKAAGIFGVALNYFIPIFILIYCYSMMAHSLRNKVASQVIATPPAEVHVHANVNYSSQQNSVKARGKRNIIKTLAFVSTAFIICASWNQWFFFLYNLGVFDYTALNGTFYHFSVVALFANCCLNPFIYAAKYEEFQRGLMKIFNWRSVNSVASTTLESASRTV